MCNRIKLLALVLAFFPFASVLAQAPDSVVCDSPPALPSVSCASANTITSTPYNINRPGVYCIGRSFTVGGYLRITSSNVLLNGQRELGYVLTGSEDIDVYSPSGTPLTNITIVNLNAPGMSILTQDVTNSRIHNSVFASMELRLNSHSNWVTSNIVSFNNSGSYEGTGVQIGSPNTASNYNHLQDNVFQGDSNYNAPRLVRFLGDTGTEFCRNTVRSTRAKGTSSSLANVKFYGSTNARVRGNTFYIDVAPDNSAGAYNMVLRNGVQGTLFENNLIIARGTTEAVSFTSGNSRTADFPNMPFNNSVTFRGNRIYSTSVGIAFQAVEGTNSFEKNLVHSVGTSLYGQPLQCGARLALSSNTIVSTSGDTISTETPGCGAGSKPVLLISRNVLYSSGGPALSSAVLTNQDVSGDYNCFWQSGPATFGTVKVVANPLFANTVVNLSAVVPELGDFRLQSSSPCLNVQPLGADLGAFSGTSPDSIAPAAPLQMQVN